MAGSSLVLRKAAWFEVTTKKQNPSRNKLLREYEMTLTPGDGACPIVDRCVWQNKGTGRDWYEAKGCPIGLKIHRHDSKWDDSNEAEWKLYLSNEVVRANAPKMYGHFVVFSEEHDFMTPVALNVLVQERVGESLGQIFDRLCLESSFDYDTKVEVLSLWEKTLVLTDNLASSGTGWWNDFHIGNIYISLCGGHMLWCALEQASLDNGYVDNMRRALKCLRRFIHLPRQWQSFHNDLMTDLTAFLSYATAATIRPGWWKDSLCKARCALEQASLDKGCVDNMRGALKCLRGLFIRLVSGSRRRQQQLLVQTRQRLRSLHS
ncbi:MAG: hypothetical protein ACR2M9_00170 [Cyanophyceae cyanobacterium]